MNAAVIEFNALADTIGTATQNHDLPAFRWLSLAFFLISGIQIRRTGGEFGGARINPFVNRMDSQRLTQAAHLSFDNTGQSG